MRFLSRLLRGVEVLKLSEFSLHAATCPFLWTDADRPSQQRRRRHPLYSMHGKHRAPVDRTGVGRSEASTGQTWICVEFSASGPLAEYLRRRSRTSSASEFYADAETGSVRNGIRCEDMQRLTYADASFDLITHSEVLEHVPDDGACVLGASSRAAPWRQHDVHGPVVRPEDRRSEHAWSTGSSSTSRNRSITPILFAAAQASSRFETYGLDIAERLRSAGFDRVVVAIPRSSIPTLKPRPVITARR